MLRIIGNNIEGWTKPEIETVLNNICPSPIMTVQTAETNIESEQNIIDKFVCNIPSDNIRNEPISKLGIVFLKFSSMAELLEKSEKMNELIQVRTC